MELSFESRDLRAVCEFESEAQKELGARVAAVLKRRLADMRAATSIKDLVAGRPRELEGADGEFMVIDLSDGFWLVFAANHPRNSRTTSGELDWAKISRIKILKIETKNDRSSRFPT